MFLDSVDCCPAFIVILHIIPDAIFYKWEHRFPYQQHEIAKRMHTISIVTYVLSQQACSITNQVPNIALQPAQPLTNLLDGRGIAISSCICNVSYYRPSSPLITLPPPITVILFLSLAHSRLTCIKRQTSTDRFSIFPPSFM